MDKKKKKRYWWLIFPAIAVLLIGVTVFFGIRNGRAMNRTVEAGMTVLQQSFTVTEQPAGDYGTIRIYGSMKFDTRRYDVEELGNLGVVTMNMGIMQMATFVLTPYEKNMPMLSTDFIYMLGNRKGYVELYDLVTDTQDAAYQEALTNLRAVGGSYSDLEDFAPTPGWYDHLLTVTAYKAGKSGQEERIRQLFADYVSTYAQTAASLEPLDAEQRAAKRQITQDYCDTMVEKGGVSTSIFKKALGDETTSDFFNLVFFGPANYAE